jgi:hypothetical protein
MNFINRIVRLASCMAIQYALVAVSQFVILDEFRYYIDKSQFQFLCFVSDEASS